MYIQDYRASKILYNFLVSNQYEKPFLIPANVCSIIPLIFLNSKVAFEFVDISTDNYCIDFDIVIDKFKKNPKKYSGVLFVRTYGIDDYFDFFFNEIKLIDQELIIIDDSCLCKPDLYNEKFNFIDLKLFSTGYAKFVDIGDGGFAFINDDAKLKYNLIKTNYDREDYEFLMNDIKYSIKNNSIFKYDISKQWLDNRTISSSYRKLVNDKLLTTIEHKNRLNKIYKDNLNANIILDDKFQQWRFNILLPKSIRENILNNIFKNGLFASAHYSSLSHIFGQERALNAEFINYRIINLFNDFYCSEEQAFQTCEIINKTIRL